MWGYLVRRIGEALLILFGISLVTFVLLYLVPADPARQIAGRSATAETVANIRAARPRPAVLRAVRPLPRQPAAGRSRPLLSAAHRGDGAYCRADAGDALLVVWPIVVG
ncbi:MAG: hypothetical protein R3D59_11135 [Paracoccaceae bacterium]